MRIAFWRAVSTAMKPYKSTSRLFVHVFLWIAVLCASVIIFNAYLARQYNPNAHVIGTINDSGGAEISLRQNRQGHYLANGLINNQPVVFLLDTGATNVTLPENLATRLNLTRKNSRYADTANGRIQVFGTTLDTVSLGNIVIRQVEADINPYSGTKEVLLGMSFLKHLDIRQQDNQLILNIPG